MFIVFLKEFRNTFQQTLNINFKSIFSKMISPFQKLQTLNLFALHQVRYINISLTDQSYPKINLSLYQNFKISIFEKNLMYQEQKL